MRTIKYFWHFLSSFSNASSQNQHGSSKNYAHNNQGLELWVIFKILYKESFI